MAVTVTGRIIKATGGFYYVKTPQDAVIECRARGLFRKEQLTPYVGDIATLEMTEGKGYIIKIADRRNVLIRPPIANIDYMVYVMSVVQPVPNVLITDKFLAVLEHKNIKVKIVLTKLDLKEELSEFYDLYSKAGYDVFVIDNNDDSELVQLRKSLKGMFCAFSGNTGVGKSTLLNRLNPEVAVQTGEISIKLGRGKHTTRHVEIYNIGNQTMVADTPGFSSLEIIKLSDLSKYDLDTTFIEFEPYLGQCKFRDCAHLTEIGCEIIKKVKEGVISQSRHNSYLEIYKEIKDIQEWNK